MGMSSVFIVWVVVCVCRICMSYAFIVWVCCMGLSYGFVVWVWCMGLLLLLYVIFNHPHLTESF